MQLWGVIGRFEEEEHPDGVCSTVCRILLTDGEAEIETARVAFQRSLTSRPKVKLGDALNEEWKKAEGAAEVVNAMLDDEDRRRAEAVYEVQERVRQILGKSPSDLM